MANLEPSTSQLIPFGVLAQPLYKSPQQQLRAAKRHLMERIDGGMLDGQELASCSRALVDVDRQLMRREMKPGPKDIEIISDDHRSRKAADKLRLTDCEPSA